MYDKLISRIDSGLRDAKQHGEGSGWHAWLLGLVHGYFEAGKITEAEYEGLKRYILGWNKEVSSTK